MTAQVPVTTQRIWGAFNPTTGAIVGVQVSGESVYQNIANLLITPTYAGVRTATHAATNTVTTGGKLTQADGGGGTFVYNPLDTTSGCVCTGTSAGTVLTVSAISSGTIAVGYTLASSVTGAPLATILSFGTGLGGTGTYNLSAPVTQVTSTTFLLDNNTTILVSADGSRWYLNTTVANFTSFLAPSGNSAINLTTPAYTFGNTTDNPTYTFTGTGALIAPGGGIRSPITLNLGVGSTNYWQINANGGLSNLVTPVSGPALSLLNNVGDQLILQSTSAAVQSDWTAPTGQTVSLWLNANGRSSGSSALLQQNATDNLRLQNRTTAGSTILGANGADNFEITPAGALLGLGPTAAAFVDMTPDKGSWVTTLGGQVTGSPTGTLKWEKQGTQVTIWADASIVGTTSVGGTGGISASGLPAEITPSSGRVVMCGSGSSGSTQCMAFVQVLTNNTLNLLIAFTASFTGGTGMVPGNFPISTANSGIFGGFSITYSL